MISSESPLNLAQKSTLKVERWFSENEARVKESPILALKLDPKVEPVATDSGSGKINIKDEDEDEDEDGDSGDEEYAILKEKLQEMRGMVEKVQWEDFGGQVEGFVENESTTSGENGGEDAHLILIEELHLMKGEVEQKQGQIVDLTEKLEASERNGAILEAELKAVRLSLETMEKERVVELENVKDDKKSMEEKLKLIEEEKCKSLSEVVELKEKLSKANIAVKSKAKELKNVEEKTKHLEEALRKKEIELGHSEGVNKTILSEKSEAEEKLVKAERSVKEAGLKLEEASWKLSSAEKEKEWLKKELESKERQIAELRLQMVSLEEEFSSEKAKSREFKEKMREIVTIKEGLEFKIQEGEMKSRMLEGGWQTLQERVQTLQKEVMEERVRGLKLLEVSEQEGKNAREVIAAKEAKTKIEEEKQAIEERLSKLEEQLKEKSFEVERLKGFHMEEMELERRRVKMLLDEAESERRKQIQREMAKFREMRNREKEVMADEVL